MEAPAIAPDPDLSRAAAPGAGAGDGAVKTRPPLGYVVATRLAIFIMGAAAIRLLRPLTLPLPAGVAALPEAVRPWLAWDAGWYLAIVERGYWFDPHGQSSVAFFPLYPLLIKAGALVLGSAPVAALLIANGAALGAILLLWRWVRAEAGPTAADDSVRWLMVYPFSFFLHAGYAESLYLLLTLGVFLAARRGPWPAAAGLAALGAVTRPAGLFLLPPLAWGLWRAARGSVPPRPRDWAALGLAPLGFLAYLVYCQLAFGDALAFWRAHAAGWDVGIPGNLAMYGRDARWLATHWFPVQGYQQLLITARVVLPIAFLALSVQVYRRLGPVAGLYTLLVVVVGTLFGLESAGREYLAAAPAFAVVGILTRGRPLEGLRMLSMGVLLALVAAFVTGRFVG